MSISGVGLSRTARNGLCNKCAKSSDILVPLLVKNMAQFGFMDLYYCINCFSNLVKKKEITA